MSNEENIEISNKEKVKKSVVKILTTIIKSFCVLAIIGFIMIWISAAGSEVYSMNAYDRNYTGGWGFHEFLNPMYGIIGIIIYIIINYVGFVIYNKIMSKFKNIQTIICKGMYVIFSFFVNVTMLIMYFNLFGSYSFENIILDVINKIIVCGGCISFPIIFTIIYILPNRKNLKDKNNNN